MPNTRTQKTRDDQADRQCAENEGRRNAKVTRDRISQDSWQIIAGGPRQRLAGAKRQNDRKLTLTHPYGALALDQ